MSRFFPHEQTLDWGFSELMVTPFNFIENAFVLFAGTHLSPHEYVKGHMSTAFLPNTVKRKDLLNHDILTYTSSNGSEECLFCCSFSPFSFAAKAKIVVLVLLIRLSFYWKIYFFCEEPWVLSLPWNYMCKPSFAVNFIWVLVSFLLQVLQLIRIIATLMSDYTIYKKTEHQSMMVTKYSVTTTD